MNESAPRKFDLAIHVGYALVTITSECCINTLSFPKNCHAFVENFKMQICGKFRDERNGNARTCKRKFINKEGCVKTFKNIERRVLTTRFEKERFSTEWPLKN